MANLKGIKKGDKVIMRLFTGAFSGVKEVEKVDKTGIYITTRKGLSKFDIKSGKMVEPAPKSEKYANFIEEYDEAVAKAAEKKRSKGLKNAAKANEEKKVRSAKKKAAEVEEIEDDEEEEDEPVKPAKKKVVKKAAKKVVEEIDDEEEEDEE